MPFLLLSNPPHDYLINFYLYFKLQIGHHFWKPSPPLPNLNNWRMLYRMVPNHSLEMFLSQFSTHLNLYQQSWQWISCRHGHMLSVFLFLVTSTVLGTERLYRSLWKGFVHAHVQISKQTCFWHIVRYILLWDNWQFSLFRSKKHPIKEQAWLPYSFLFPSLYLISHPNI